MIASHLQYFSHLCFSCSLINAIISFSFIHYSPLCVVGIFFSQHTEVSKMDSINKNHYERTETNPKILLQKSIILLLSRWYALQMAIENHWGGSDSLQKSHQLAADLFSWFSKSKCCIVFFNSLILFCFLFI